MWSGGVWSGGGGVEWGGLKDLNLNPNQCKH